MISGVGMGLPSEGFWATYMHLNGTQCGGTPTLPKYAHNINSYLNVHSQYTSSKLVHTYNVHTSTAECKKVVSDIFCQIELLMEYQNTG